MSRMPRKIGPGAWLLLLGLMLGLLTTGAGGQILTGRVVDGQYPPPPEPPGETPPGEIVRPGPIGEHLPEVGRYLDRVRLGQGIGYRNLVVFPVLGPALGGLPGQWLSLDQALGSGDLVITEKGAGGSVPVVVMENRSRTRHVLAVAGELIAGGKQTRTIRQDVILAPGQRLDVSVLCVEQHRWEGGAGFSGSGAMAPASIQQELRKGAGQDAIWSEVARNNKALDAENRTGSLESALKSGPVQDRLTVIRREFVPHLPGDAVGYVFVDRRRGVLGAELFGEAGLARALFPKLLDAYAVDVVILRPEPADGREDAVRVMPGPGPARGWAEEFVNRIRRGGSERDTTPGSGAGVRLRGVMGSGVSLAGDLVHLAAQTEQRIAPPPLPGPPVRPMPMPEPRLER